MVERIIDVMNYEKAVFDRVQLEKASFLVNPKFWWYGVTEGVSDLIDWIKY